MIESVSRKKNGMNDMASTNETPVQILVQRLGMLVPDGVPGVKLESGTKLTGIGSSVVHGKLTTAI